MAVTGYVSKSGSGEIELAKWVTCTIDCFYSDLVKLHKCVYRNRKHSYSFGGIGRHGRLKICSFGVSVRIR